MKATNATNPRQSKHSWPIQPRPGPRAWQAWKKALQRNLSADGKGQKLRQPLGHWTTTQEKSRQQWRWYFNANDQTLIQSTGSTLQSYQLKGDRHHRKHYDSETPTNIATLPDTAIPTTVTQHTTSIRSSHQPRTHTHSTAANTFKQYVDNLDPWETSLFSYTNTRQHTTLINALLTATHVQIVSDGGMAKGFGSYGWNIEIDHNINITGQGEAEGKRELMQSFRAEGYGMLAALRFTLRACEYHNTWPKEKKTITMYCDNMSLTQRIQWHHKRTTLTPKNTTAPDYDIESAITATIDRLDNKNIYITAKHVRGHQDKHKQYHQLPREAQLNIEADIKATNALKHHSKNNTYQQPTTVKAMLYTRGQPITSKEAPTLRTAILSIDLIDHMTKREDWHPSIPGTISWEAHKRAIKK